MQGYAICIWRVWWCWLLLWRVRKHRQVPLQLLRGPADTAGTITALCNNPASHQVRLDSKTIVTIVTMHVARGSLSSLWSQQCQWLYQCAAHGSALPQAT